MRSKITVVLLWSLLCLIGCTKTVVVTQEQLDTQVKNEVSRYGNGIYFFPYSSPKTFANKLSQFLDVYDGQFEIVSITQGGYHYTEGYIVVLRAAPLDNPVSCGKIKESAK